MRDHRNSLVSPPKSMAAYRKRKRQEKCVPERDRETVTPSRLRFPSTAGGLECFFFRRAQLFLPFLSGFRTQNSNVCQGKFSSANLIRGLDPMFEEPFETAAKPGQRARMLLLWCTHKICCHFDGFLFLSLSLGYKEMSSVAILWRRLFDLFRGVSERERERERERASYWVVPSTQ